MVTLSREHLDQMIREAVRQAREEERQRVEQQVAAQRGIHVENPPPRPADDLAIPMPVPEHNQRDHGAQLGHPHPLGERGHRSIRSEPVRPVVDQDGNLGDRARREVVRAVHEQVGENHPRRAADNRYQGNPEERGEEEDSRVSGRGRQEIR